MGSPGLEVGPPVPDAAGGDLRFFLLADEVELGRVDVAVAGVIGRKTRAFPVILDAGLST